jgi:S-formylglutathione hydrolase FrmB
MPKQISFLVLAAFFSVAANSQTFQVSYTATAFSGPFTGRVILYLNKENKNPKNAPVDVESFPCFAVDIKDAKPGTPIVFDDHATSYPVKLSDLERGEYYVQAVWDRNLGGRAISRSPGNLYSRPLKVTFSKDVSATFALNCDQVVAQTKFTDTKYAKELKVPSLLLSRSQGKPMTVDAAVLLPREYYSQPLRRFPVLFWVSGYGGDYHRFSDDSTADSSPIDTISCITVYLDGNCAGGHSVYANSDNNGPWGDALTREFIPQLEKDYRCNGARLLKGHSSGGWTVLGLQTHYPDLFAGCWASSPDPVDFRSFLLVNLYSDANIYYNNDGMQQPLATIAGALPVATMKQCYQQEFVIYRGDQLHSFNQVFSAKGPNGQPVPICDPVTGAIDKSCFEHWKSYDICAYLRNNWPGLQRSLQSKIRVSVGNEDNFLLNYAVHLLDDEMKKLDTRFVFKYYPGDHFTVSTPEYQTAGMTFLAERYAQWKNK